MNEEGEAPDLSANASMAQLRRQLAAPGVRPRPAAATRSAKTPQPRALENAGAILSTEGSPCSGPCSVQLSALSERNSPNLEPVLEGQRLELLLGRHLLLLVFLLNSQGLGGATKSSAQ